MKKLIILSLCALMFAPAFAQEASVTGGNSSSSPGFRFGIKVTPNVSWFRPSDKKLLEGDGAKMKIGFGLITEFRLAQNYSFSTGIEFPNFSGGNLKILTDSISYIPEDDTVRFYLTKRSYNLQYVEIPIMLKLKTNEIGYMTYYGLIGGQIGIRTKARADDEGTFAGSNSNSKIEDVDVSSEMWFGRAALSVGAGAEYNLSGNTSLAFGLSYMYGLTNAFASKPDMLKTNAGEVYKQKANIDQVVLTVGILF